MQLCPLRTRRFIKYYDSPALPSGLCPKSMCDEFRVVRAAAARIRNKEKKDRFYRTYGRNDRREP